MNKYLRLIRFDKPIGVLLLSWPMLWALWLAAGEMPPIKILVVFLLGAFLLRSAGCIVNDIADREFDRHVERTQARPLTTGEIDLKPAVIFFLSLLSLAFLLVLLTQNLLTILLACVAPVFVIIYPFTKRVIHCPQFFLGIAFAWAVPMAFAAVTGTVPAKAWLVYAIALLWPVMYDTQYAMVDRDDDLKIGVHSTAVWWGNADRYGLLVLQVLLLILFITMGSVFHLSYWYDLGISLIGLDFVYQQKLTFHRNRQACFRAFLHNNYLGGLIFVLVVCGLNVRMH